MSLSAEKISSVSVGRTPAVLVVDDEPEMARIIGDALDTLGYERVEVLTNGMAALARLRERPYDVVISDWNMSPMSGYDLLRAVRADPKLHSLPFIMISGNSAAHRVLDAVHAGATHFISKPFTPRALERSLRSALAA